MRLVLETLALERAANIERIQKLIEFVQLEQEEKVLQSKEYNDMLDHLLAMKQRLEHAAENPTLMTRMEEVK